MKSNKKKETPLKVHGTFEDIIKASVSNIDMKKVAAKKKATKKK